MVGRRPHRCSTKCDAPSRWGFGHCFAPGEELPPVTLNLARQMPPTWNTPWTHTCHTCNHPWTGLLMEP